MKPYLKSSALRLTALITVVITALIIHSCRKEGRLASPQALQSKPSINADIPALKQIYAQTTGNHLVTQSSGYKGLNLIRTLDVNWNTYTLQKRTDSSIVAEFDMNNDTGLFALKKVNATDTFKYVNKTTVVFIKYKNGNRLNFFSKVIEDLTAPGSHSVITQLHYNEIPLGFNGMIFYYTLDQQYINGYHFTNGVQDGAISFPPPGQQTQAINSLKTNLIESCETYSIYQTSCTYGGTPDDPYKYLQGCTDTYIGSVTVCDNGEGGGSTAGGDSGGGGTPGTTPPPCSPSPSNTQVEESVSNGRLIINVAAPPDGGSGGTTPPPTQQPCPSTTTTTIKTEKIIDSVENPCLHSMVEMTISDKVINQINTIIQNVFGSSTSMNITFVDVNNLPSNVDGYTDIRGGVINGNLNVQIQLDNNHLPNFSQQYVARVIMHEALHAYLTATGTLDQLQHESMVINYVTKMAASLQQMFPGLSSTDAKNLALGGLQLTTTFQNTIENDMGLSGSFTATNLAYSVGPSGLRCP